MITPQYDTTITKTRYHDSTMMITRQYDGENTIVYRIIIIVLSYCRVIIIVLSRYHHRTVAFSLSYCRNFAFSSSYYRVSSFRSTHSQAMALTVFRSCPLQIDCMWEGFILYILQRISNDTTWYCSSALLSSTSLLYTGFKIVEVHVSEHKRNYEFV